MWQSMQHLLCSPQSVWLEDYSLVTGNAIGNMYTLGTELIVWWDCGKLCSEVVLLIPQNNDYGVGQPVETLSVHQGTP